MFMNLVGQQFLFEVPNFMKDMDEDIVYSMIESHSSKASQQPQGVLQLLR